MNKLRDIYTKENKQFTNNHDWAFTIYYNAFKIVYDKFSFVKMNKKVTNTESKENIFISTLFANIKYKEDLSDIHIGISNSLTNLIVESYNINNKKKLSLSNKNNIKYFLTTAFQNKKIPKKIEKEYITIKTFCKNNKINESKLKVILKKNGYYNNIVSFMPSRKSMDKDKVFITNYFMPERTDYYEKIDNGYLGNFYILWEEQFLRNMMLKHYKKCEKDSYDYYIRYRQPKTYYILVKRISELIALFKSLDLSILGNYKEKHVFNDYEWSEFCTEFHIVFTSKYRLLKVVKYSKFKDIEIKINNIVENNIETIDDETLKKGVKKYLNIFNKYAKHYEIRYNN